MSMYGEDGSTGYAKEDLRSEIDNFLESYTISEMMEIVIDAIKYKEYQLEKDNKLSV